MCAEQLLQREGRSVRSHHRFLSVREWNEAHITGDEQPGHFDEDENEDDTVLAELEIGEGAEANAGAATPFLTFEEMLQMMASLQHNMDMLQASIDEHHRWKRDGDDSDDEDVAEDDGSDLDGSDQPFLVMMVNAVIYHMPALQDGSSVWEEEMANLRCPYCDGDIYTGCAEWCDHPNEDYEVAEGLGV